MKEKISAKKLKEIQVEILDAVASYCAEHGINYWLDCGTLLGAIRHDGYIPWDDDIDIGMLRSDFDRFIHEYRDKRYVVSCIDNDKNSIYCHAKVNDTRTVLYEPDENGSKISVNIDVFVYDEAPDDDVELKKMFDRRDFYRNCNTLRNLNNRPSGNLIRRMFVRFLRIILKPFPKSYFIYKMAENSKKYNGKGMNRVGNFTSYTRQVCKRSVVDAFTEHVFEGKMYKIPVGYDEWLKSFYGDYMTLPPVEKRVSHHKFVAYLLD